MMDTYDWWVAKLRAIRHSKPPEPPMRVRLHEAGHAVAGHRFGYVQQGIMLREDDTGQTSQQYATGMDDDMSVRLQTETIISMAGFAVPWNIRNTGPTRSASAATCSRNW